ncbi:MAG: ABC transporter ATP-binding protein [Acidobacteria bacterium]|nr:ABC transporter ATP-binding protein [Acidobacteriota bacterium]MBI3664477.1 ABC transporter ATP-binding protein [Acidobacteriota bacterium]
MTAQGTEKATATLPSGGSSDSSARAAAVPVIRAENIRKTFPSGGAELTVLAGVNLSVGEGELVAIVGPSGSGKSTLLHILAALDTPTSGAIYFAGHSLEALTEAEVADFRNRRVAFVWQRHHLLPDFTAAENVAMPLLLRGASAAKAQLASHRWLEEVGLAARAHHRAGELSGGEQQRVAIARALIGGPALLLADEPTGDLDEGNAETVFELMQRLHRSHRLTSILATHNLALARRCHRGFQLEHGILEPSHILGLNGAQRKGEIG